MATAERMVHLALSQKAAEVVDSILEEAILGDEFKEDWVLIFKAIRADIKEQIEAKPKKPKKKGPKK